MTNALALSGQIDWNDEMTTLAKQTVCKGASDAEFKLFIEQCKVTKLNPFARQIYSIRRKQWDSVNRGYIEAQVTQVSIDGFRLIADRTQKYAGQVGPWWCGKDGEWKEVWLDDGTPAASKVGVLRHDFQQPIYAIALYKSYVQTNAHDEPVSRWKTDPAGMIAKCAESLALRRAFPQELSGLYTTEEMTQADNETIQVEWKPAAPLIDQPTVVLRPALTNGNGKPAASAAPVVEAALDLGGTIVYEDVEPGAYNPANFIYADGLRYAKLGKYKWPFDWYPIIRAAYSVAAPIEVENILIALELSPDCNIDTATGAVCAWLDAKADGDGEAERLNAGRDYIAAYAELNKGE